MRKRSALTACNDDIKCIAFAAELARVVAYLRSDLKLCYTGLKT
jgi:hypothetical protein